MGAYPYSVVLYSSDYKTIAWSCRREEELHPAHAHFASSIKLLLISWNLQVWANYNDYEHRWMYTVDKLNYYGPISRGLRILFHPSSWSKQEFMVTITHLQGVVCEPKISYMTVKAKYGRV